ncbi:winged helix-turn-helix domain-containing protein, partial [Nocardiopsis alba]|uniref:helix-turn-helix domain-containing protein n=1 Tax=Nocardiopsis alba TaxID=53437 RepID=UPI0033E07BF3
MRPWQRLPSHGQSGHLRQPSARRGNLTGATRLMHRLGFTPQVPTRRAAERDEQAVAA